MWVMESNLCATGRYPGEIIPKLGCLDLLGRLLVDENQSGL